jgi:hypothetical protein
MWAIKKMRFKRHRLCFIAAKTVNRANRFVIRDAGSMFLKRKNSRIAASPIGQNHSSTQSKKPGVAPIGKPSLIFWRDIEVRIFRRLSGAI